jgi:hypothetical protein
LKNRLPLRFSSPHGFISLRPPAARVFSGFFGRKLKKPFSFTGVWKNFPLYYQTLASFSGLVATSGALSFNQVALVDHSLPFKPVPARLPVVRSRSLPPRFVRNLGIQNEATNHLCLQQNTPKNEPIRTHFEPITKPL